MTRWLYHARIARTHDEGHYAPSSLASEGFVHCSFAPALRESIALYFAGRDDVEVLQIDPRRLDAPLEVAETPRGPMPHVHGAVPHAAIAARWSLVALPEVLPDELL